MSDEAGFFSGQKVDAEGLVRWPADSPADCRLAGPPAIIVCYIPHYGSVPNRGGWNSFWALRRLVLSSMFKTGNRHPPLPFSTHEVSLGQIENHVAPELPPSENGTSLSAYRLTKEFRACVWLPQCYIARVAGQTILEYHWASQVGYTPCLRPPEMRDAHRSEDYVLGLASAGLPEVKWKPWGATLVLSYGFRIAARVARAVSLVTFLRGIPYMRLRLRYEINVQVRFVTATFSGTHIPSAAYQLGASLEDHRHMEDTSRRDIIATLTVGHEAFAPWDDAEKELFEEARVVS